MWAPSPEVGLQIEDLHVSYDGVEAVRGVSLQLPPDETLAVLGPSGCGKSTLLRAIAGLKPVSRGRISFDSDNLSRVPTHKRGFALVFQDGQLFDHLSVARNIGYALKLRRVPRPERAVRVEQLLELVGLQGYADRAPATLSGGERQRVALARALAVQPRLMLLDEPLSALDAGLRQRLAADLRSILADTSAVMVTHDQEEAFAVADRLAVMRDGLLIQQGPVDEVWSHPADAETAYFLGYATVLEGDAARSLSGDAAALALRRSALVVDPDARLRAEVTEVVGSPAQLRLLVEVIDPALRGQILPAVAARGSHVAVGDEVGIRLDRSKVAAVGRPV